jgi:hypothetical protein
MAVKNHLHSSSGIREVVSGTGMNVTGEGGLITGRLNVTFILESAKH